MSDPYICNHSIGAFILIDELSNETAGAGIIWYHSGKLPEENAFIDNYTE